MTSNSARQVLSARVAEELGPTDPLASVLGKTRAEAPRGRSVRGPLVGAALLLLGAVAGLAVGQAMARSAHQTGACVALNMAAALGYLDVQQRRQVMHALVTAINPDADLFPGGRRACNAGAGG